MLGCEVVGRLILSAVSRGCKLRTFIQAAVTTNFRGACPLQPGQFFLWLEVKVFSIQGLLLTNAAPRLSSAPTTAREEVAGRSSIAAE